ncbi:MULTISPECIES: type II toxin-antitoxin system RelE/ParE family toxin [Rickettsieae]|uniref:type II toxin-antitoxin system RelE/ParE family toxin n=1 Tax=Rickettsieae TaxID=33988 RepID=UPI00202410AE|nr:type II toxin-antitoxin system RelE/ParE family toxin [Rickettsia endosymbiont of Oedothorax gibbosus]
MIRSFKCKKTNILFEEHICDKQFFEISKKALIKLAMIDAANILDDLMIPPANRLEKLQGDRANKYSIRINDKWRICFVWNNGDAYEVEIIDYHK